MLPLVIDVTMLAQPCGARGEPPGRNASMGVHVVAPDQQRPVQRDLRRRRGLAVDLGQPRQWGRHREQSRTPSRRHAHAWAGASVAFQSGEPAPKVPHLRLELQHVPTALRKFLQGGVVTSIPRLGAGPRWSGPTAPTGCHKRHPVIWLPTTQAAAGDHGLGVSSRGRHPSQEGSRAPGATRGPPKGAARRRPWRAPTR